MVGQGFVPAPLEKVSLSGDQRRLSEQPDPEQHHEQARDLASTGGQRHPQRPAQDEHAK